jgi:hypothetical protein
VEHLAKALLPHRAGGAEHLDGALAELGDKVRRIGRGAGDRQDRQTPPEDRHHGAPASHAAPLRDRHDPRA